MYTEAVQTLTGQAVAKLEAQRRSLVGHLVRSALAGMYVGAAIVLIFTIGGSLAAASPGVVRLAMGVCFGGALTIVVFAGSELFTGSNLVLTLGVLSRKARGRDLLSNWLWTWIGNLAGSVLVAFLVVRAGLLDESTFGPINAFVQKLVATKMNLPWEQLLWRAVLANWFVCLGVWMAARVKSETARILLIWWCMFTFITSGYEHSIANMCGLMLGLLIPHGPEITWGGYAYNLGLATLGNIIGGALFVAGAYWIGSPKARDVAAQPAEPHPAVAGPHALNGAAEQATVALSK
ncbi:MAG TPA: formate/nitrite transporter family protein [Gemmataceae bacterium]|nr:formate/nitrite transporter family protein [Gemmataceae bacterium]